MENLWNPKMPSSLISIFLFSLQISLSFIFFFNPSWAFSPTDNHLINCGSELSTTTLENRQFIADSDSSHSNSFSFTKTHSISVKDQNPSKVSSPIYNTARVFTKPSNYEFEIRESGTHLVRLHFNPFSSSNYNLSDARFHVSVPGVVVLLNNFNGGDDLKEYLIWVENGKLSISFVPSDESSFAFVNAIEVISAPKDLIADTARFVNGEGVEDLGGLIKKPLQTVYRINVGGVKVTPFNDTLWRTWVPDDGFLNLGSASKAVSYSGHIKYQVGGASREVAPDNVYNSARVMANPIVSATDFNITWDFPVKSGYRYLVRMHFCDIASLALNELYFNVYVNGFSAYQDLDLSTLTQMLASPFYADFLVDAGNTEVLRISVGPSSLSNPARINAILNGIEIMRTSNSMGCLDGEMSDSSILESSTRGNGGVLVPSIAVMSMLLAAFAIMHRKRTEVKEYMGWSPLPVDEKPR